MGLEFLHHGAGAICTPSGPLDLTVAAAYHGFGPSVRPGSPRPAAVAAGQGIARMELEDLGDATRKNAQEALGYLN